MSTRLELAPHRKPRSQPITIEVAQQEIINETKLPNDCIWISDLFLPLFTTLTDKYHKERDPAAKEAKRIITILAHHLAKTDDPNTHHTVTEEFNLLGPRQRPIKQPVQQVYLTPTGIQVLMQAVNIHELNIPKLGESRIQFLQSALEKIATLSDESGTATSLGTK